LSCILIQLTNALPAPISNRLLANVNSLNEQRAVFERRMQQQCAIMLDSCIQECWPEFSMPPELVRRICEFVPLCFHEPATITCTTRAVLQPMRSRFSERDQDKL
jgi:hypothetical protein